MYVVQGEEAPVQGEISFHQLARQVCDLLDCHAACLLPCCPEPALRHPLLDLLPFVDDALAAVYGPRGQIDVVAFLRSAQVRAVCDLAAQTGNVQRLAACSALAPFQSQVVIPLERPTGLLGFLLLLDERPEAFTSGDMLLLDGYLPPLLECLEKWLRNLARQRLAQCLVRLRRPQEARQPTGQEEADRIDNKFLSMVMHELRTPLAAIKGYAALLQAYPPVSDAVVLEEREEAVVMTPQRQQQYLTTIMEQVTHLEVLVRDLLDISRIHAGRLSLRSVPVDLVWLCQHVVELLRQRVRQQGTAHELRCVAPAGLPHVWADPDRVQQALTNLLENAIKYSPGGGLIEVCISTPSSSPCGAPRWPQVEQETQAIQVTVRDHGVGIAPEQQAQLFKPFQRLEHPLTTDVGGAGLGLYITRKFIHAMGGQIALESRAGEGTTVSFTLPVSNHNARNTESQVLYPAIAKRHPVCYSVSNMT